MGIKRNKFTERKDIHNNKIKNNIIAEELKSLFFIINCVRVLGIRDLRKKRKRLNQLRNNVNSQLLNQSLFFILDFISTQILLNF